MVDDKVDQPNARAAKDVDATMGAVEVLWMGPGRRGSRRIRLADEHFKIADNKMGSRIAYRNSPIDTDSGTRGRGDGDWGFRRTTQGHLEEFLRATSIDPLMQEDC